MEPRTDLAVAARLDDQRRRLFVGIVWVLFAISAFGVISGAFSPQLDMTSALGSGAGIATAVTSLLLVRVGRFHAAVKFQLTVMSINCLLIYGFSGLQTVVLFMAAVVVFACYLDRPDTGRLLGSALAIAIGAVIPLVHVSLGRQGASITMGIADGVALGLVTWVVWRMGMDGGMLSQALSGRLSDLEAVQDAARLVSIGDLRAKVEGTGQGAVTVRNMVHGLKATVTDIQRTGATLGANASQLGAMVQRNDEGATSLAGSVDEMRRTMDRVVESAHQISYTADVVSQNANESSKRTAHLRDQLAELGRNASKIREVLDRIKEIGRRADSLALNASLEAARAGEGGRGFSLVAAQMQRLVESVLESVVLVEGFAKNVTASMERASATAEDVTAVANTNSELTAQIREITVSQEQGAERVAQAIGEIALFAQESAAGSRQATLAVRELQTLASHLDETAQRFRI